MLEGGTFDEVPEAPGRGDDAGDAAASCSPAASATDQRIRSDAPALARRHVYVDTMGIHPAVIRCADRSARCRSRADGHRLADRGGEVGAGAAAKGVRALPG